jgi:hypothetical protein
MIKRLIYIFSLALFLVSCTEKIDIQLDDSYTRLVVEGNITNETSEQSIRLTSSAPYFSNQPAPPVTGATVSINDGTNTFILNEKEPGLYVTTPDFAGTPGRTYTLNIELKEAINNLTTYTSSCYMNDVVQSDSIGIEFHDDWGKGIWEVKWYAQEPAGEDYYLFRVLKNDTLYADSLKNWFAVDDRFLDGNYTNGIGVWYFWKMRHQEVNPGDKITLKVCGITKDYKRFVEFTRQAIDYQSPMFSGPPANVPGNISGGAIGYFAAYAVSYSSTNYKKTN